MLKKLNKIFVRKENINPISPNNRILGYKANLLNGEYELSKDECPFSGSAVYAIQIRNEATEFYVTLNEEEYHMLLPYGIRKDEEDTHLDDIWNEL